MTQYNQYTGESWTVSNMRLKDDVCHEDETFMQRFSRKVSKRSKKVTKGVTSKGIKRNITESNEKAIRSGSAATNGWWTVTKINDNDDSDDSDDSTENDDQLELCNICLSPFKKQLIGIPSGCNHYFCLNCILCWSKRNTTCPLDRKIFHCILVKNHIGGKTIKRLPVKAEIHCAVCDSSDRQNRMRKCSCCGSSTHIRCLSRYQR